MSLRLPRPLFWTLFVIAASVVVYYTLKPNGPDGPLLNLNDKLQHLTAYTGLSFLAGMATRTWRQALVFAVLLALAGYSLEFLQVYFGRDYDPLDALANMTGCAIGFLLSRVGTRLVA